MRLRLYEYLFRGPGPYTIGEGEHAITIDVAADGTFERPTTDLPLYAIAAVVGGKRDFRNAAAKKKTEPTVFARWIDVIRGRSPKPSYPD